MKWLAGLLAAAVVLGGGTGLYFHFKIKGDPDELAAEYFAYWQAGDLTAMRRLVASPPADFVEQHRGFSNALQVTSLSLTAGPLARPTEDTAQAPFTAVRTLPPGEWSVESTLRLRIVDRHWRVIWTPATLLPALEKGGQIALTRTESSVSKVTDRDGGSLPESSSIQQYTTGLADSYGGEAGEPGWAIVLDRAPLKIFSAPESAELKTTIDAKVQRAADDTVKAAGRPAAVVALRPSTGEILAIADRLDTARGAVNGQYPPGSTFKVVTAAALVTAGLSPGSKVGCPATALIGQRTIPNHEGLNLGATTLREAFAQSCNTTFAELGVTRAKATGMTNAAVLFGFNRAFAHNAARASFPASPGTAALAEASIGQGDVLASPLNMAAVSAAVADGTWRSPRMLSAALHERRGEQIPAPRSIPTGILNALRPMMRAVVTTGTAADAGLPPDTYGKTGTAEYGTAGASHAWFIGYRKDLAFTVFVPAAGSGPKVAAPLAATFLKSLLSPHPDTRERNGTT